MENNASKNVETALIQHRLVSCNAEAKIQPSPKMGGNIEILIKLNTPETPEIIKKNDMFDINVMVEVNGKVKETDEIAFNASCEMEGTFQLVNCEGIGIPTSDGLHLWTLSTKQLFPLVAQFANDLISKLGFKNINIPASIPGKLLLHKKPVKKPAKKTKK